MTQRADVGEDKAAATGFWRSLFSPSVVGARKDSLSPTDPLHCDVPVLRHAEIAAVYTGQRVAGDFYDFLRVGPSRMLFVLLDIAGLRADTREILIAVQKTFQTLAPELFVGEDFNETTAMIELCHEMNRTILRGGLRSCPAFIGCYNEDLGTVCYANAGHTPALLRDGTGITLLEATGLPLGLFSHTTQSAAACHLVLGSGGRLPRADRSGLSGCGIRDGRGGANASGRNRAQRTRPVPEHVAGDPAVYSDGSDP